MTLPRPIPILLAALGMIVLVSTGVGLWLALSQKPPAWFFLSFELVVALGAVFLVMLGRGKFKEGPAIALLCCAGSIGVCSLLGWQATGRQINGQSVTWLLLLRVAIAGLLVLAAAAEIVLRDPRRTLPRIGWGLATAVPLLVMLVLLQRGSMSLLVAKLSGGSQSMAFGIWMIVALIGGALVSACGHLLITGFQIGVTGGVPGEGAQKPDQPKPRPATAKPQSSTPTGTTG